MATEVKICGLCLPEDAAHAARAGADYVGVVFDRSSHRGQTGPRAREIFGAARGPARVGVFVDEPYERLLETAALAELDVLQLHGGEAPSLVERLRSAGSWRLWKAVRPQDGGEFRRALERYGGIVDAILVDGWTAEAAGGTGARFPWGAVAAELERSEPDVRIGIAGGLDPGNVAEAMAVLRPSFVDVSSGVEGGECRKDPALVESFIEAVRAASRPPAAGGE